MIPAGASGGDRPPALSGSGGGDLQWGGVDARHVGATIPVGVAGLPRTECRVVSLTRAWEVAMHGDSPGGGTVAAFLVAWDRDVEAASLWMLEVVVPLARARVRRGEEAGDVAQEVAARILATDAAGLRRARDGSALAAVLSGYVRNVLRERRWARRREVSASRRAGDALRGGGAVAAAPIPGAPLFRWRNESHPGPTTRSSQRDHRAVVRGTGIESWNQTAGAEHFPRDSRAH